MDRRIKKWIVIAVFISTAGVCLFVFKDKLWAFYKGGLSQTQAANRYDTLFIANPGFYADGFDYPVGKPDGKGYYDAQPFMRNTHLGCDWNGVKGGNTDLGDPVYSIANGYVTYADDVGGGWGNIVRVVHCINGQPNKYVESLYAHLDKITVAENTLIAKGQKVGTIGTAHGAYVAHLHFELRHKVDMNIGPGYSTDTTGYLNPTTFIKKHRLVK
jgi:murein DD-endopeptidase MepM/ murein hydrolase activator NlpD